MTRLPLVDDHLAHDARQGAWCPKLCSHTCPVLRATGRHDAVPWSFHRTVDDLVTGRLAPADAAGRLVACSGCGTCAEGCVFPSQDVPAQVRAGRAVVHAAGAAPDEVEAAVAAVADGRSPYGTPGGGLRGLGPRHTAVVPGCRDGRDVVAAAQQVLAAGGLDAAPVTVDGCCGAVLDDLGAVAAATAAGDALAGRLAGARRVVLLDPHCRGRVEAAVDDDVEVVGFPALVATLLADGDLALHGSEPVAWHEPCVVAGTPDAGAGPRVLAAVGSLVELEGESHPGCSGGGLGLPLLDPDTAAVVASDRVAAIGRALPVVTGCAGAARLLVAAGADAAHLAVALAQLLPDEPEVVA